MGNQEVSQRANVATRRALLLLSTAAISLGSANVASAQSAADFAPELAAQGGNANMAPVLEAQANHPGPTIVDPQILIADPGTPTTALDPVDINGVGQMVVDIGGGFIGLCTASLINPRTVIFAAHCVNDEAATAYGATTGGTPIGFGFSNYTLPGIVPWYLPGADQHKSNPALAFFNGNYVSYHPGSLEPDAFSFLYSDVAVASLDTPAAGIPTWALLFSPLPANPITADGTGYHVAITGYGRNGTGTTGAGAIDFRRRSADNMLGALASLNFFETFLFGSPNSYDQNLYWIDFDDPRRGSGTESFYDFNAWRDNATATEGSTSGGDSGGPLILDQTFGMDVIIGVLSGGYTRFFSGQPANGYGTAGFYQPLYLYWDWIAANNPYHYVSAKAGDGSWSDPTHWQTNLDPSYMVIDANGNLVNGVPTDPGVGTAPQPGFGQACFQFGGISDCKDVATGVETIEVKPIGTGASSLPAKVEIGTLANDSAKVRTADLANQAATPASTSPAALPTATLGNGLPGASGFVPNNDDGDRLTATAPRYFDVTLSATGTTTLSSAVTIDRFAISGAGAALDIASAGSLTSLIDINQYQGMMRVNGTLTTRGDYMLMTGGLQGSGTINTPFFTNVAGVIAPGGIGTTGTLTFNGNAILSSGSSYQVDIGANGVSDRIVVNTTGAGGDGMASIGGNLVFGSAGGALIRDGYTYTFLTAASGHTGTFNTPAALSAILRPTLSYSSTAVSMSVTAGKYVDVVDPNSPVQLAYARLLDQNRGQYSRYADLFGPLDIQNQATIRSNLEGLAPRAQSLVGALGMASTDVLAQFARDRLAQFDSTKSGGTVSMIGSPLDLAGARVRGSNLPVGASEAMVEDGSLPSNINLYLAAGYINGDAAPMVGTTGRNNFDGWYGSVGVEFDVGDNGMLGLSAGYAGLDGTVSGAPQSAGGDVYQAGLYGRLGQQGKLVVDGQFSIGLFDTHSSRTVNFVGTPYTLTASKQGSVVGAELGLSQELKNAGSLSITPRAAFRFSAVELGEMAETGGPMALQYDLGTYRNVQARLGATFEGTKGKLRPFLSATYVHDFEDRPAAFAANLVGGTGPNSAFALAGSDNDWAEVAGGVSLTTGDVELSITAQTTIARKDFSVQSYSGSLKFHF